MSAKNDLAEALAEASSIASQIEGWCLGLADHCRDLQDATTTKTRAGFLAKLTETVDDSAELAELIQGLEEARDRAEEAAYEVAMDE